MANRFSETDALDPNDVTGKMRRSVDTLIGRLAPTPQEHELANRIGQPLFEHLIGRFEASTPPKLAITVPATLAVAALRAELWATHMEERATWEAAHPLALVCYNPQDQSVLPVYPPEDRAGGATYDRVYDAIAAANLPRIELPDGEAIVHERASQGRWAFAFTRRGTMLASGVALATPRDPARDGEAIKAAERLAGSRLCAGLSRAADQMKRPLGIVAYQSDAAHQDMKANSAIFNYLEAAFGYDPEKDAKQKAVDCETESQIGRLLSQLGLDGPLRESVLQTAHRGFGNIVRTFRQYTRERQQFYRCRVVTLAFGMAFAHAEAWYKMQPPASTPG